MRQKFEFVKNVSAWHATNGDCFHPNTFLSQGVSVVLWETLRRGV